MGLTPLQRFADILRKIYLLQLADFFWFIRLYLLVYKENNEFRNQYPNVPVPPPLILYDIQGNCSLPGFYYGGLSHAHEISQTIAAGKPQEMLNILEWGCGPARVLRHLQSPDGSDWRLWGSDYNAHTISWCKQHWPTINFLQNGLAPPIPAENGFFDVIYCVSVFTHLSKELHQQWITEIIRLLKPGGLFIGTFHGEEYRTDLTSDEQLLFDSGELVTRGKTREGKKNFGAYHCDSFVRKLLSPFRDVKKLDTFSGRQTAWSALKESDEILSSRVQRGGAANLPVYTV